VSASGAIVAGLHPTFASHETIAAAVELDFDVNGNVIYFGFATPGSSVTDAVWQIKKLVYSGTGNLLSVFWANGASNFINAWSGRAGLAYS
jgi:hypothetical protein